MILAYNKIIIKKSSYGTHGRPMHSKKTCSHTSWFWLLELARSFKFLMIYNIKLV